MEGSGPAESAAAAAIPTRQVWSEAGMVGIPAPEKPLEDVFIELTDHFEQVNMWSKSDFDKTMELLAKSVNILFENKTITLSTLVILKLRDKTEIAKEFFKPSKKTCPPSDWESIQLILVAMQYLAMQNYQDDDFSSEIQRKQFPPPKFSDYPNANPIAIALTARLLYSHFEKVTLETGSPLKTYIEPEIIHAIIFHLPNLFDAGLADSPNAKYHPLVGLATHKLKQAVHLYIEHCCKGDHFTINNLIGGEKGSCIFLKEKHGLVLDQDPKKITDYFRRFEGAMASLNVCTEQALLERSCDGLPVMSVAALALFFPWDIELPWYGERFAVDLADDVDIGSYYIGCYNIADILTKHPIDRGTLGERCATLPHLDLLASAHLTLNMLLFSTKCNLPPALLTVCRRSASVCQKLDPKTWIQLHKKTPSCEWSIPQDLHAIQQFTLSVHKQLLSFSEEVRKLHFLNTFLTHLLDYYLEQVSMMEDQRGQKPDISDLCFNIKNIMDEMSKHVLDEVDEDPENTVHKERAFYSFILEALIPHAFKQSPESSYLSQTISYLCEGESSGTIEQSEERDKEVVEHLEKLVKQIIPQMRLGQQNAQTISLALHITSLFELVSSQKMLSMPLLSRVCSARYQLLKFFSKEQELRLSTRMCQVWCDEAPEGTRPMTQEEIRKTKISSVTEIQELRSGLEESRTVMQEASTKLMNLTTDHEVLKTKNKNISDDRDIQLAKKKDAEQRRKDANTKSTELEGRLKVANQETRDSRKELIAVNKSASAATKALQKLVATEQRAKTALERQIEDLTRTHEAQIKALRDAHQQAQVKHQEELHVQKEENRGLVLAIEELKEAQAALEERADRSRRVSLDRKIVELEEELARVTALGINPRPLIEALTCPLTFNVPEFPVVLVDLCPNTRGLTGICEAAEVREILARHPDSRAQIIEVPALKKLCDTIKEKGLPNLYLQKPMNAAEIAPIHHALETMANSTFDLDVACQGHPTLSRNMKVRMKECSTRLSHRELYLLERQLATGATLTPEGAAAIQQMLKRLHTICESTMKLILGTLNPTPLTDKLPGQSVTVSASHRLFTLAFECAQRLGVEAQYRRDLTHLDKAQVDNFRPEYQLEGAALEGSLNQAAHFLQSRMLEHPDQATLIALQKTMEEVMPVVITMITLTAGLCKKRAQDLTP